MRKIDDYLIDFLRANNAEWLIGMIGFGNIKVESSVYIGDKRNADLLVTIFNHPYNGEQKVAIEVENDREFDVDEVLRKIKKDQPCPTIAIIPEEHEKDAWRFQASLIKVWFWRVKCRWKCQSCSTVFTTTSSITPKKCQGKNCRKGSNLLDPDGPDWIEHDGKPFIEASNNPSGTWAEIQAKLRPKAEISFVGTSKYSRRRLVYS